ncbi:zinc finger protein 43 isoform X2 [Aedes aegypti]|nr:zinc finger protein 43 isoform X2 [Aedes aegypti]
MDENQFNDRCRLCLDSDSSSPVSSMDDEAFRTMLDAVCNFVFVTNDQLPSKVCWRCSTKIMEFHCFTQTIKSNQEKLLAMLPSPEVKLELPLKNEIFLEATYEVEMNSVVKLEQCSEEEKIDEPGTVLPSEDEKSSESESPDKVVEATNDDILIKQYFSLNCDSCSKPFDTYKQLSQHTKEAHKRKPTFQCCTKTFQTKHLMLRHINTHLRPFKCDICGKTFSYQQTLVSHRRMHLSSEDKPFKCVKCSRSFTKSNLLRTHMKTHDRVECPICQKSLANVQAMRNHTLLVHSDGPKYICDVCGKECKTQRQVETHRIIHTEPTRADGAQCGICHAWISRKEHLRRHITDIHESKETECDICHKTYPNLKAMRKHKGLVHVGLNFKCEVCGKRFKKALNLTEHRASAHTGEKLYSCEFCGMEMNSNGNLYAHKKNKHPLEWMEAKKKAGKVADGKA